MANNRRGGGGSATGGGMNFQAAVSAIATVHMISGQSLLWLKGLVDDIPVSVEAETDGPGDDIRLRLKSGDIVEVQVKKGLQSGSKLWDSLIAMAKAVNDKTINYGVLIVSPTSSITITDSLSKDILRLGDGRSDNLSEIATKLVEKLSIESLPVMECCQRIRIQTINAMQADQADIRTARTILSQLLSDQAQVTAAWNSIYKDASASIELKGRRDISSALRLLRAEGIKLSHDSTFTPVLLLDKLSQWVFDTNACFSIFGANKSLRIDEAWVPLRVIVQDTPKPSTDSLRDALRKYQSWDTRSINRDAKVVDPETLGRFVRRGILIGGPGMGKTTLLKRIARRYSEDRIPVLHMKLKTVAARMRNGNSFEEAAFSLSLDGSGISYSELMQARFSNWLLLCDGLDECGDLQEEVATGILRFSVGHPDSRVLVTTRPVGYAASHFSSWQHYNLASFDDSHTHTYLTTLVAECISEEDQLKKNLPDLCKMELENKEARDILSRSPLLLGLAASVIAQGESLGATKAHIFEQIFQLIDESPNSRWPEPPTSAIFLQRYLDILGWHLTFDPLCSVKQLIRHSAEDVARDLGRSTFNAQSDAESFLKYWENVGVVERIGSGLDEILTFIHKSFGEFSAARYLVEMPVEQQNTSLIRMSENSDWEEVVKFSAQLGLANNVCRTLISDNSTATSAKYVTKIGQALKIIAEVRSPIETELHDQIIDAAFEIILSDDSSQAFSIGDPLVSVARRFPNKAGKRASEVLEHNQSWTNLIAWSVVTTAGSNYYDTNNLQTALLICIENIKTVPRSRLSVTLPRHDGHKLLQSLILTIIEIILEQPTENNNDATIIDAVMNASDFVTAGFFLDFQKLLISKRRFDLAKSIDEKLGSNDLVKLVNNKNHEKQWSKLFEAIFDSLEVLEAEPFHTKSAEPLLNLSAFLEVSGFWEMPISDLRAWIHPFDKAITKEVFNGLVGLSDIDVDALRIEVRWAKNYMYADDVFQVNRISRITTRVDITKVDWASVSVLDLDRDKITEALFHHSRWLVQIATKLIRNMLCESELELLVQKLLRSSGKHTLWAASNLVTQLDSGHAVKILLARLSYSLNDCEYLFGALSNYDLEWGVDLSDILQQGLYQDVLLATEIAELSLNIAKPGQDELEALICDGLAYWFDNEKPYPTGLGTIPPSPREKLLEALIKIRPLSFAELKLYADDSRLDVRRVAENAFISHLESSSEDHLQFLSDINTEKLDPSLTMFRKAFGVMMPLNTDGFRLWKELIVHNDSRIRFVAMDLLDEEHLTKKDVRHYAQLMLEDDEKGLRARASRIIEEL